MKQKPFKISFFVLISCLIQMAFFSDTVFAETAIQQVNFRFNIRPIFELEISSEESGKKIDFGNILPGGDSPPLRTLQIRVITNTRHHYRIYHQITNEATNTEGASLPSKEIRFSISDGKNGGVSKIRNFMIVPSEETLIFESDSGGNEDIFFISYSLNNQKLHKAGSYYGNIRIWAEQDE